MSFEYNGVVYRDLEPQVRYDAEQVQVLKQADVTINENLQTVNENLQTINAEVNGKLDKPANPSAERAVTILADGTVGTKLLSEIGGGKLYRHKVMCQTAKGRYDIYFISSNSTEITTTELIYNNAKLIVGSTIVNEPGNFAGICIYCTPIYFSIFVNENITHINYSFIVKISDSIIEL